MSQKRHSKKKAKKVSTPVNYFDTIYTHCQAAISTQLRGESRPARERILVEHIAGLQALFLTQAQNRVKRAA